MSPNPFDELLLAFREEHRRLGGFLDSGFGVYLLTRAEADSAFKSQALTYIGTVFFREDADQRHSDCRLAFGNFRSANWETTGEALRSFGDLARRASTHLPLRVQESLSAVQNDLTGWWLAYMMEQSPPIHDEATGWLVWREPFAAAAAAIERGGLAQALIEDVLVDVNRRLARPALASVKAPKEGAQKRDGQKVRRGRPSDTDPKDDARLAEAWATGGHKLYRDLAREKGLKENEVRRALDRHRKRQSRKGVK